MIFAGRDPVAIDATAMRLIEETRLARKMPSIKETSSASKAPRSSDWASTANYESKRCPSGAISCADFVDWELLKRVSRSFYITLRLLPEQVRETIALAYLLARISDTEADGAANDGEAGASGEEEELTKLLTKSPDKDAIEKVWTTIREGQEFDEERFKSDPAPLSATERDCYTYLVAGCTWGNSGRRLCASKIPDYSEKPFEIMLDRGTRFGKGLQLVNILRDRAADAKIGRFYVTEKELPSSLENRTGAPRCCARVWKALKRGRLRVACALPLLIGLETLDLVEEYPEARRVKVSRLRVWVLLLRSLVY